MLKTFVYLCISFTVISKSLALKCYTCGIGENDADTTCVTDPANAAGSAITDCDAKYCTIIREELLDPKGQIRSFNRGCTDKPTYIDEIVEDSTSRFYYKACKTDLCNGGSGKGDDNDSESGALGDKSMILCPGTGSNTSVKNLPLTLLILSIILSFMFVL